MNIEINHLSHKIVNELIKNLVKQYRRKGE